MRRPLPHRRHHVELAMKKILGLVFNRWTLLALLLGIVLATIWLVGELLALGEWRPLGSPAARWIFSAVVLGGTVLVVAWRTWRNKRGNQKVVDQLVAAPTAGPAGPAESADMAAVRQRFETALVTLRNARFGAQAGQGPSKPTRVQGWMQTLTGRFLYELPWYTIIGAPGSGKTTALRNAGLQFPLADRMGEQAVKGVGGTRNCDWWFTDQAVLIDTAGRFVTQDSDQANDKATWAGFLQLLKKSRPRQPLNGVLVTVSVADLIAKNANERAQHAQAVRARVQELHEQLHVRLPIYLLVTKCDLMAGFAESFVGLDKEQRATPWGFTVPLNEAAGAPVVSAQESLVHEFGLLLQRLNDGLVDRLQAEADPQRRSRIYGFPNQFANLREPLHEFVQQVFSPSPFEAQPMLRGLYFVSGTQEGSPIDRVLGAVARRYQLEQAMLPPQQASGRSYFLQRLLTDVVFAEQGIAGTNRRWERRRGAMALAGYVGVGALTALAAAMWLLSWSNNKSYIDTVAARVENVRRGVQETLNLPTSDLRPVIGALEATRGLAAAGDSSGSVPWSLGFGLYQGRKLDGAARTAYEHMLVDAVQPRLAIRVEEQLRAGDQPESQYEALKTYMMLFDPARFDAASVKAHIENDWDVRLASELTVEQHEAMSRHLDALLAQGAVTSSRPLDKDLVEATRTRLAAVPLQQRVYNRLRQRGVGDGFPEFTITKAGGANALLVFTRAKGAPLTRGVPGLFTYKAYHEGFQKVVGEATKQLADEQTWVLGIPAASATGVQALQNSSRLVDDVRRLYLQDYRDAWKAFIADVRLQPSPSIPSSIEKTRVLAAVDTPLVPLLKAMSKETTLLAGLSSLGTAEAAELAARRAAEALQSKVLGALGAKPTTAGAPAERIESIVDNEFEGLRRLVTAPEGGKAPIDNVIARLGELQVLLIGVDNALKGGSAPPPSPLPVQIRAEAANTPEPLRSMLETLGKSSANVASQQQRETLAREVRAQVGDFCNQAITGRYPFDKSSAREVTLADFATLFGPGGKFDQMQQRLASFIDTSTNPWSFRAVEGTPLGQDAGSLPQFQRAAAIRETFFSAGAAVPTTRLEIKPVEMDSTISNFTLDVDGQIVRYAHGPQTPAPVTWPGKGGTNVVSVMVQPGNGMRADGPWALFRLFDRVSFEAASDREKYRMRFDLDGRSAKFDVTMGSVRNPFRMKELQSFSCPNGL
jgi:type VI secretion system protein ImpL